MTEKQCGNCKHFSNYYIRTQSFLRKTANGVCTCGKMPWTDSPLKPETDTPCENWVLNEYMKEESKKDIQLELRRMAKRIEEMALILKGEK
ncbi:MAG: hypothetical protein K2L87_00640 [Clostridiales bacterium]|nr:hypothetical protein [Clostridiales bacterium]